MKKQSNTLFMQMNAKQIESLTTIVNETLATGFNVSGKRVFTTAELWNIQRQGKSSIQRRFLF